ncbi:MAG: acireductone synthase [Verrucomicrobiae bacterium]|nr:acireductone synthase [Verrucomicrobiae bacterium]
MPGARLHTGKPINVNPAAEAKVILLDIEGTTTPIDFVYQTLFPFARERMESFVEVNFSTTEMAKAVDQLKEDYDHETESDKPDWSDAPEAVANFCLWLMDRDRKATGLKTIQGLIWKAGYASGDLQATVYDDVAPAMHRWIGAGKRVCIYSSGSVLAQKLLFKHTIAGDLTGLLSAYFDTTTGPKKEAESYRLIASELGIECREIFFLSDNQDELKAAEKAGCSVGLAVRDDPPVGPSYTTYTDFTSL